MLKGGGYAAAGHTGTATPAGSTLAGDERGAGLAGGASRRPRPARDSQSGRPLALSRLER
jgi:hypothetical protein